MPPPGQRSSTCPATRIGRPKPQPRPPEAVRPKTLSISDIATLMADPYAIYARKILNIYELDPLDEESDPQFFGDIVHAGLAEFFAVPDNFNRPDAAQRLNLALQKAMREKRPRAALENWWSARLERIAAWIAETEQARRAERGTPAAIALERSASMMISGGFELKGRADRIERARDGGITLVDYKTGSPPSAKDVKSGTAPQFALEGVMAEAGAFGEDYTGQGRGTRLSQTLRPACGGRGKNAVRQKARAAPRRASTPPPPHCRNCSRNSRAPTRPISPRRIRSVRPMRISMPASRAAPNGRAKRMMGRHGMTR